MKKANQTRRKGRGRLERRPRKMATQSRRDKSHLRFRRWFFLFWACFRWRCFRVGGQGGNRSLGSSCAAVGWAAEEAHGRCGEAVERAAAVAAASHQNVGHELRFAFGKSRDDVDDGGGVRT